MDLGEKRDLKNLVMNESFHKTPNLEFISLDPQIEETMEVLTQAPSTNFLETQAQVQQVQALKVLSL